MHGAVLEFGQQVEPTRLIFSDVIISPLWGRSALSTCTTASNTSRQGGRERSGGVKLQDSKATGRNDSDAPASPGRPRIADTANVGEQARPSRPRRVTQARSTGADVGAALSASTLCCPAAPHANLARGAAEGRGRGCK